VILELSEQASNAILDALAIMLDGGSIELLADNGRPLAVLKLSSPATIPAVDGELEFRDIAEEDSALAQGTVTSARIIGMGGIEVLSCDVGDENSDAVIKLNTTQFLAKVGGGALWSLAMRPLVRMA
jgi:hypothetical protein